MVAMITGQSDCSRS